MNVLKRAACLLDVQPNLRHKRTNRLILRTSMSFAGSLSANSSQVRSKLHLHSDRVPVQNFMEGNGLQFGIQLRCRAR